MCIIKSSITTVHVQTYGKYDIAFEQVKHLEDYTTHLLGQVKQNKERENML